MVNWLKKSSFFIIIGLFIVVFLFLTREKPNIEHEMTAASSEREEEKDFTDNQSDEVAHSEEALVDIKGEVKKPGVYELSSDARVQDVVQRASGFTKKADETSVNLAEKIHDEMIIIVPGKDEGTNDKTGDENGSSHTGEKIRLNYATQEEIETLSGIGPSKAQAIIEHREENGLFQTTEDLLEISGIGEKTLENFSDDIQIP